MEGTSEPKLGQAAVVVGPKFAGDPRPGREEHQPERINRNKRLDIGTFGMTGPFFLTL